MRIIAIAALLITISSPAYADLITELRPNPPGADPSTQEVELSGTAGASFSYVLVSIEGDTGASGLAGTVDRLETVTGTYDSAGIAVVTIADLENPAFTLILADGFTGSIGDDLDVGDLGTLDTSGFTGIMDAIGVPDSASSDLLYGGVATSGANLTLPGAAAFSEPTRIFRDGSTGDWFWVDSEMALGGTGLVFDEAGAIVTAFAADSQSGTSFGTLNAVAVPEPGSMALLAILGAAGAFAHRRREVDEIAGGEQAAA